MFTPRRVVFGAIALASIPLIVGGLSQVGVLLGIGGSALTIWEALRSKSQIVFGVESWAARPNSRIQPMQKSKGPTRVRV